MITNLEITFNGVVLMNQLTNVLVEEIEDLISIHADNGFMINIPKDELEEEEHEENRDIFELAEGFRIVLEYT